MCDVHIRELGYNPKFHKIYTIQCALPINLYNQQVFTFLWFWLVLMQFVNIFDFIHWTILYFSTAQKNFFKNLNTNLDSYLEKSGVNNEIQELMKKLTINSLNDYFHRNLLDDFLYDYLSVDGIFLFKLISKNFGDFIASELLHESLLRYTMAKLERKNVSLKNRYYYFNPDSDFI